jgi:magnesium-transporting ATPase (P-type)
LRPSLDEITLVDTAMNVGFHFFGASKNLETGPINSFEFDSARKRRNVIIREIDGLINLFILDQRSREHPIATAQKK